LFFLENGCKSTLFGTNEKIFRGVFLSKTEYFLQESSKQLKID